MFSNILVVCVGNICRSPMAEALLSKSLRHQSKIAVTSAGITALADKAAASDAIELANNYGIDLTHHRGKQLDLEMIHRADLILVMEEGHIKAVEARSPESRGKVHLLGKWNNNIEIPDPYRQGKAAFELSFKLIDQVVTSWVEKLCR